MRGEGLGAEARAHTVARRLQRAVRTSSLVGLGELLEVGKVVGAQLVDDAGQQVLQLCEGGPHTPASSGASTSPTPLHANHGQA